MKALRQANVYVLKNVREVSPQGGQKEKGEPRARDMYKVF